MNAPLETQQQKTVPSPGDRKPDLVEISINSKKFSTERGKNSVEHLRALGSVPASEILSELKNGKFHDLKSDGHVEIKGAEVFVSHPPSGGSS
jgi:hypothetical protein